MQSLRDYSVAADLRADRLPRVPDPGAAMTTDAYMEQRAILTRAADIERQRQAARDACNVEHQRRLESELQRLGARYAALEIAA